MTTISALRRVAIIQARMSSSRFPGKVLEPLMGMPLIIFMAQRVRMSRLLDHVLVATSTHSSDDPLAAALNSYGVDCYRGSLEDVLDRFWGAARHANANHVVRLTGDCPVMDSDLIDTALRGLEDGYEYFCNVMPPTFPDGLDVEAFTIEALHRAWSNAQLKSEREHVTPYLRSLHSGVKGGNWSGAADFSKFRWTVDHPDDLEHVRRLVEATSAVSPTSFDRFDIYRAVERSRLSDGACHERNEGFAKSLQNDDNSNDRGV